MVAARHLMNYNVSRCRTSFCIRRRLRVPLTQFLHSSQVHLLVYAPMFVDVRGRSNTEHRVHESRSVARSRDASDENSGDSYQSPSFTYGWLHNAICSSSDLSHA